MKQTARIKSLQLEGLLTGVTINTSAADFAPIKKISAQEFQWRALRIVPRRHQ
jgi:branched-chain amino acid transport system substrate-binding protein